MDTNNTTKTDKDKEYLIAEGPDSLEAILDDLLQNCHPETLLSISADLKSEETFSKTLSIQQWKSQIPDLHKKPTIFLLGR